MAFTKMETERLTLRVVSPEDGPALNRTIIESLDQLQPWLDWMTPPPSVEETSRWCRQAYARYLLEEEVNLMLLRKEDGALAGVCGLRKANAVLRHHEVGYWGAARLQGAGYMTEGVKALVEYALLELAASRVYLTTDERNLSSRKLAERAGFQLEGVLRNERMDNHGQFRNTCVYARIAAGNWTTH
ncbi:Acetyltransferase, including N-acetylases of ribosomal protein [Hahella chejuensis KCTC 2396]|uniref:Acetyltransferase, including N-acetylases of ribosomal protein n=1 Tax=Hahella chejuensis (strain KCTC 2396) TaxID=349521 RepID=Q2SLK3_HAHCH|nr:GNAT family protein [Hahella chejuensis]ABC28471.1 Acetyltransferase, including N-acetylases of ribosomal protein [Hahella chejuensis KCTC 2396]